MTGSDPKTNDEDGGPVDTDLLDRIAERLSTDSRFATVEIRPPSSPEAVVCIYNGGYYPPTVSTARVEITWFENGDFSIHYHEQHDKGQFDHRWDRHPSTHNAREHIHPGPDAPTPGVNTEYPTDWRDILSVVLTEIENRQQAFWRE